MSGGYLYAQRTHRVRNNRAHRVDTDCKMSSIVFSIILVLPLISCENPQGHWTLLPNILVVEVDGTLGHKALSCLEPEDVMRRDNQSQDIVWKKNGEEQAQTGNSFLVMLEESMGGGNYTCHSKNGSLLNHTVVLINKDGTKRILVKDDQEDYLKCSTQNYNGEFHCSWTWHSSRVGKVAFITAQRISANIDPHCSMDTPERWMCFTEQSNFSCSVLDSGNGISCVERNHCPYAEESQQIDITVYVKTEHFLLEKYSKHFYLSEIVKPDKVKIGKVNTTVIEWSYPSSWSSPYSYFPLTFQITQLKGGCRRCDDPCTQTLKTSTVDSADIRQFEVKRGAKAVCVRAKDTFCNSRWSEWSHVRLRRRNKKNKQQNKQQQ